VMITQKHNRHTNIQNKENDIEATNINNFQLCTYVTKNNLWHILVAKLNVEED
jgi:hypothetical protein